jgi:hypothetical protein
VAYGKHFVDTHTIGAFRLHALASLASEDFDALVMTSGNFTDETIISQTKKRCTNELRGVLTSIGHSAQATTPWCGRPWSTSILRRPRFAPHPIRIAPALDTPQILAVGGE